MQFGKNSIEMCGKLRKYKRISKGYLKEHQKNVEELFKDTKPLVKQSEKLLDEYQELVNELKDLEEMINVIRSKQKPSDEELNTVVDLIKEKKEYREKIKILNQELTKFQEEHEAEMNKIIEEVPNNLAKLASNMVEITEEEFLENYTDDDELLVKHLSFFKQMNDAGNSIKDMEKLWRDIIKHDRETSLNLNPS